jgi:hypothetical protein
MKILYVCADPGIPLHGRKGCSTHVRETCLALIELGHQVKIVCSNVKGDQAEDRLDVDYVPPFTSRKLGFDFRHILLDRRIAKRLTEQVEAWRPDALYERYSLYSRAGTQVA